MTSYVDPIINAVVLSQVDLRRDIGKLLTLNFPERFLPTFLHEGTHHSCFMSPVGQALALLRMRAYRRAIRLRREPNDPNHESWDLLEDVLRQEATIELLRPLSEGLACFSELDAVPGDSNVISVPMNSAYLNFGGRDNEFKKGVGADGINVFLYYLLYRARLDPELTQRRENVLAAPFSVKSGGYLSGYMSIKYLWQVAKESTELANDSELFCTFVRSYFYDDYGLVAHLLCPEVREADAVNAIASYLLSRIRTLLQLDWRSSLSEFSHHFGRTKQSYISGGVAIHVWPGGMANDLGLNATGERCLDGLLSELLYSEGVDEIEASMREFDLRRLQRRDLLCLGSLEGEVEVDDDGHASLRAYPSDGGVAETPTMSLTVSADVKKGKGRGSLEFYLIPRDISKAHVLLRENEILELTIEGSISEARKRQIAPLFTTDRSSELKIIDQQETNLRHVIDNGIVSVFLHELKETAWDAIDDLYGRISTCLVDEKRYNAVVNTLREGGLYAISKGDTRFLEGLSFLGVAGSVLSSKQELTERGRDRDVDVDYVIEMAKKIEKEVGLPFLRDIDGHISVLL